MTIKVHINTMNTFLEYLNTSDMKGLRDGPFVCASTILLPPSNDITALSLYASAYTIGWHQNIIRSCIYCVSVCVAVASHSAASRHGPRRPTGDIDPSCPGHSCPCVVASCPCIGESCVWVVQWCVLYGLWWRGHVPACDWWWWWCWWMSRADRNRDYGWH